MARSPYAAPRRPPRWPWFAGATVVLAIIAFAGVAASTGSLTDADSAMDRLAQLQVTATDEASESTPPPAPTEPASPTATPEDTHPELETVRMWFNLWTNHDFAGMYHLTGNTTRTLVSEEDFVSRYEAIEAEAGIKTISATVTGGMNANGRLPYTVTFDSSLIGEFTQQNAMTLVQEGEEWRVAWAPSLIFSQIDDTGCVEWQGEPLRRGRIIDRDGEILAEDAEVSQVGVVPGKLAEGDEDATIDALGTMIDMDPDDIHEIYERDGVGADWFVPIKNLPASRATELINEVIDKGLEGVIVQENFARTYPHGPLFAHVTGYVSPATQEDVLNDETGAVQPNQMVGRSGLEYGANEILSGKPGGSLNVVDCDSRTVHEVISEVEGVKPLDIYLTIDLDFQQKVADAVANLDQIKSVPNAPTENADTDEKPSAPRGAAVVLDPRTGAVLAMVSSPTYDPNGFVTGAFDDEALEMLSDPVMRPEANRATSETYPAGSIFKVVTTAAAMVDLGYKGDTQINCPASFSIGDQTWNDWVVENGLSAQGQLTLHSGLVQSCNTVFYQIGANLDYEDPYMLPDMAREFGLGSPTLIPYFPEVPGVVPDPAWKQENIHDGWSTGDNVNLAIGQGYLLVTPLQMANVYASIANGGYVLKPYIVDKAQVPGTNQVKQIGKREVLNKLPLDDDQIAELQSALRDQTSNTRGVGSARIFGDMAWPIAGKTGTAQNGPQVDPPPPHSWFAAYGPAGQEATIASVVMFEQVGEGIQYAAPVTRAIYDAWLRLTSS